MSLIFGRLGQSFINSGITLQSMGSTDPSPEQYAAYQEAAETLKRDTARNALWLVCIGECCSQFCHRAHGHFGDFVLEGLRTWITTYSYMATWALTSERNTKRIRENYLRAVFDRRCLLRYFRRRGRSRNTYSE